VLLEARTNRWHGHFEGDQQAYRPAGEVEAIHRQDPVRLLALRMEEKGWADSAWMIEAQADVEAEIAAAAAFGEGGTPPEFDAMCRQIYHGIGTGVE
jgi:pyruvate dehydrogenase E1 component alpha subunit